MQSTSQPAKVPPLALWKWASMVILVYVFIAGWIIPLKPGITGVTPDKANAGNEVTLKVTGYNTYFQKNDEQLRAWLRLKGDTVIQARKIEVKDDRNLTAVFYIPSVFPVQQDAYPLSLILDQPGDGSSVLPNAIFISPSAEPDSAEISLWHKDKIDQIHKQAGIRYPFRNILAETIRNTYFHVPMWFSMIILFGISAWYSLRYYRRGDLKDDRKSIAFIEVGLIFGLLGLVTGMLWAKNTWNA